MSVNTSPSETRESFPPPTVGALSRLAWLAFRERIFAAVQQAGYTDLQPVHVLLFRYPTIDGMRPSALADQMSISKQAINDLIRQMEARGYLSLRADPADGRARLITLTQRGTDLMELIRDAAQDIADDWARIVGRKRFEAFKQTLADLVEATHTQHHPDHNGATA